MWPRWLSHGNWTAPGLSGGRWVDDPSQVDWSVDGIDELDRAAKIHDWRYQHGLPRWVADYWLVQDAVKANVQGTRANVARVCVIIGMSAACAVRWILGR